MRATMTDSEIIDELGGTSAVALIFGVKPPSVSEWRTKGIPKARKQTLKLMRPDLFESQAEKNQEAA